MSRPLPTSRDLARARPPPPPPSARRRRPRTTATASLGVVVTGGTRGLGFELASSFLASGDRVVICGRSQPGVDAALAALRARHPRRDVHGSVCDVGTPGAADALAAFAADRVGVVDRWLNNAGLTTPTRLIADVDPQRIADAVSTNVAGTLLGCRAAINLFRAQPADRTYHMFSYGFSTFGRTLSKTSATHKSTKAAVSVALEAIADELQAAGIDNVGCWQLSPGLVLSDLLLEPASSPVARRIFNVLAEEPATVAAALTPRIRAATGLRGAIEFLTPPGTVAAFAARGSQAITGGRFFDRDGVRVREDGATYSPHGAKLPYNRVASRDGEPPTA